MAEAAARTKETIAPEAHTHHGVPREFAEKVARGERPAAKPIEERHFFTREVRQNEWFGWLLASTTVEDVLDRGFWGYVAMKLRPGDKVVLMSEDRRLYLEVIVFAVGGNWAEVRVFGEPIIVPASVGRIGLATDYEVRDLGLIKQWGIVNRATGREVQTGFKTEDVARTGLRDFLSQEGSLRRAG